MNYFKIAGWVVLLVTVIVIASSCQNNSASEARSDGERAFRSICTTCHRLPGPSDKSDEEWPGFLGEHADRAGLTDEQVKIIVAHLTNTN